MQQAIKSSIGPTVLAASYQFVEINVPDAISTEARGINAKGDIVGGYIDADEVTHGFLLRKEVFTTIDVPNAAVTLGAHGITAQGDIVGSFRDAASVRHGYLLHDGQFTQIDFPGASGTLLNGINNTGDISGQFGPVGNPSGSFILKDGVFHNVHVPGSLVTIVFSATNNGQVLVGHAELPPDGATHGFVRTKSGDFQLIDFPGLSVPCTGARSINRQGDIVGIFTFIDKIEDCGKKPHGFLLQDGQYTQIDVPGSESTGAIAINNAGVIVGRFTDKEGNELGFKAVPRN